MNAARLCQLAALLALAPTHLTACMQDNSPVTPPDLSFDTFACEVQPVLAKSCSAPACHGSSARHFKVVAPARMRLSDQYLVARAALDPALVEDGVHPPLTDVELRFNYQQAMGFSRAGEPIAANQLLSRPLAVSAGGLRHAPAADVFIARTDPGFQAIARWLAGEVSEACP